MIGPAPNLLGFSIACRRGINLVIYLVVYLVFTRFITRFLLGLFTRFFTRFHVPWLGEWVGCSGCGKAWFLAAQQKNIVFNIVF